MGELGGLDLAPLTIDIGASPCGLRATLAMTAPPGVCTSSGDLHRIARAPITLLYGRNAGLHVGRTSRPRGYPHVLGPMSDGRLRPEQVTTHVGSLDDAPAC